jgi:hypothetical protein
LVKAENAIPESEFVAKDEVNTLRTKYHELLMDKLRENGIEFIDRFHAANIAYDLVAGPAQSTSKITTT